MLYSFGLLFPVTDDVTAPSLCDDGNGFDCLVKCLRSLLSG